MNRNREQRRALTAKETEHIAALVNRRHIDDVSVAAGFAVSSLHRVWEAKRMTPTMIAALLNLTLADVPKRERRKRTIRPESRPYVPPASGVRVHAPTDER